MLRNFLIDPQARGHETHLGNRPTGNVSTMGEAGLNFQYHKREIHQNFKTRFLNFNLDVPN